MPWVADETSCALHPRIAGVVLDLRAKIQLRGLRHGHNEAVHHVVGGQASEGSVTNVCVDGKKNMGTPSMGKWSAAKVTSTGAAEPDRAAGS